MRSTKFDEEVKLIKSILENDEILEINLVAENELEMEIALIVTPDEYIQAYVRPLSRIGYKFYPDESNIIQLYFHKGETYKYNLHLTQAN